MFVGGFSDWDDVVDAFWGSYNWSEGTYERIVLDAYKEVAAEPDRVFYAEYDNEGYEGSAAVTWVKGDKFYFLSGSHCSCYGLEESADTWEEFDTQESFVEFLKTRDYGVEQRAALHTLGRLW